MYKITSIPEFLYHITPKSNLEKIKNEGLDPNKSESSLNAVFLALYKDIAEAYACMKDEECVLLKISTSGLNEDLYIADNYELQDFINKNETDFHSWEECLVIDSLNLCGQCAYKGLISPNLITY